MGIEKQEACQLYIEQEIDEGLKQGKTPYTVAKEIIPWLQKLFDVRVNPKTIESKAYRKKQEITSSEVNDLTTGNDSGIEKNKEISKGFTADGKPRQRAEGAGRPPKFRVIEPAHRTSFTGENEWYTPVEYIEKARIVLCKIDLDPASSDYAQERIKALCFHTISDDGLKQRWKGKVWLNPPYAQPAISDFVKKMVEEVTAGNVEEAIMLTHNYTDTGWFHMAESVCAAICFTRGRIKFEKSDGTIAAPTQGQAFFYYGSNLDLFKTVFSEIGFVR